jgi:hypothetical protein
MDNNRLRCVFYLRCVALVAFQTILVLLICQHTTGSAEVAYFSDSIEPNLFQYVPFIDRFNRDPSMHIVAVRHLRGAGAMFVVIIRTQTSTRIESLSDWCSSQ